MVAAQNFLCAGCGTPIEPSKYGQCITCLVFGHRAKGSKVGERIVFMRDAFDEELF